MSRVHNFCPGPCTIPLPLLEEVQAELLDFEGSGMSLVESSHRSSEYDAVHQAALQDFRTLAEVPDTHEVLFVQGGATLQFAMVPLNLLGERDRAAYVDSGTWGSKAIADAEKVANIDVIWSGRDDGYRRMPTADELDPTDDARFVHLTGNETIGGIRFPEYPHLDRPMVGDLSSEFLARPVPWDRFDLVYGGAQKNLGPAGLAIVVVRKDRIGASGRPLPSALDYAVYAASDSLPNTPPMFSIYVMGKVLRWMQAEGGVAVFESRARDRAGLLYAVIDESDFYVSPVAATDRSHMNVVFRLADETLEQRFLDDADAAGLRNLKGHRSVGGVRASVYNGMATEGVEALVAFMREFRRTAG